MAMLLPFFIIRVFPDFFHTSDVDDLWRWSQAWGRDWRSVYINCDRCNYPFLGTMFSGGVMDAMHIESFARLANRFRYYLALVDALNIFLIWFILKKLNVENAPLWAGLIGLLPSSWLGSSVWGQIDGIGQFLILLFFILLIWFNREERSPKQTYLFAALAGILLSCMLLTKQLIYFSVFALGMIFLANVWTVTRKPIPAIASGAAALVSFLLPVILIDLNLNLNEGYFSHLQYILATGSKHGDVFTYTGFNLWVFFSKDLLASSHQPIQIGSVTLSSVTPYSAGMILFLLVNAFLLYLFVRKIYEQTATPQFVLMSLLYLALVNLSFNITLTGTHERYLYHFYPFILIACLAYLGHSNFFNRSMLAVLLSSSMLYGVFLFSYLRGWVRPNSHAILQGMSIIHMTLFIYLIYSTLRELNPRS